MGFPLFVIFQLFLLCVLRPKDVVSSFLVAPHGSDSVLMLPYLRTVKENVDDSQVEGAFVVALMQIDSSLFDSSKKQCGFSAHLIDSPASPFSGLGVVCDVFINSTIPLTPENRNMRCRITYEKNELLQCQNSEKFVFSTVSLKGHPFLVTPLREVTIDPISNSFISRSVFYKSNQGACQLGVEEDWPPGAFLPTARRHALQVFISSSGGTDWRSRNKKVSLRAGEEIAVGISTVHCASESATPAHSEYPYMLPVINRMRAVSQYDPIFPVFLCPPPFAFCPFNGKTAKQFTVNKSRIHGLIGTSPLGYSCQATEAIAVLDIANAIIIVGNNISTVQYILENKVFFYRASLGSDRVSSRLSGYSIDIRTNTGFPSSLLSACCNNIAWVEVSPQPRLSGLLNSQYASFMAEILTCGDSRISWIENVPQGETVSRDAEVFITAPYLRLTVITRALLRGLAIWNKMDCSIVELNTPELCEVFGVGCTDQSADTNDVYLPALRKNVTPWLCFVHTVSKGGKRVAAAPEITLSPDTLDFSESDAFEEITLDHNITIDLSCALVTVTGRSALPLFVISEEDSRDIDRQQLYLGSTALKDYLLISDSSSSRLGFAPADGRLSGTVPARGLQCATRKACHEDYVYVEYINFCSSALCFSWFGTVDIDAGDCKFREQVLIVARTLVGIVLLMEVVIFWLFSEQFARLNRRLVPLTIQPQI